MLVTDSGICTEVKELQPLKAWTPMLLTDSGICTEVKELQPRKASLPMLVTVSGICTEVKELQLAKAAFSMVVTVSGISAEFKVSYVRPESPMQEQVTTFSITSWTSQPSLSPASLAELSSWSNSTPRSNLAFMFLDFDIFDFSLSTILSIFSSGWTDISLDLPLISVTVKQKSAMGAIHLQTLLERTTNPAGHLELQITENLERSEMIWTYVHD